MCMERKITHTVNEEAREEIQYYHRICAVTVVSSAFPIPLGIRFQKKGETKWPVVWTYCVSRSNSWGSGLWMCWWPMLSICKRRS
jgi:hypothetical protein